MAADLSTHVVSTGDADDVALELVSEGVDGNLLGHTLLVEDAAVGTECDSARLVRFLNLSA